MAFSHARNSLRLVRCMSSSTRSGIVGVVGAGQMGCGIAQVAATAGYPVILCDSSDSQLASSIPRIRQSLARLTRKSVISEADASAALSRITTTARLDDLSNVHLALEAVPEVEPLKLRIFQQLDRIVADPAAILATNTSSISVTRIGAATSRPERVIGLHFMNPPPLMQLVEVIPGLATSEEVVRAASALVESMGKKVTLARDMPGFIVNRVLMPMINEAFYALYESVGTAEDIDAAMKLGTNQPMGPLQLADFIGLDTCLAVMRVLHAGLGDSKYRPCPLLVQYVDAGHVGKKCGKGVYKYQ
eukprot:jgi/Mesvir1/8780/Mv02690-RA.1